MSGGTTVEAIDAVDAFARTLYLRANHASSTSPRLYDIAQAVRTLHLALRHLRIEAADPDSLLNTNERPGAVSLYARQIRPIVEDCGFALKQLETVLERHAAEGDDAADGRVAAIRAKLVNEKTNIDMFLDTVQLHNPATKPNGGAFDASSQTTLEGIKDQVDAIAARLFAQRDGSFSGEESLWKEFKMELEKEGFSPDVLRKHKDVLRAYIRELESMSANGGTPPTVRGLLAYEASSAPSPKEMMGPFENEKCFPSMKAERRMPDSAPVPPPPPPAQVSYERHSLSSDDYDGVSGDSMALISTRDLVAMDTLNAGMASMQLQPPGRNYSHASPGNSPRSNQKYLPSNMPNALTAPPVAELSGSPGTQLLGTSPRYVPPLPAYSSAAAPYGSSPHRSHLAPDRWGNEIPMDAQWTRIKRTLVSPEVLERAGVRYEARPEFVAVLGHLSREQIAEFAHRSAEARAARSGHRPPPRKTDRHLQRERQDSKSSRTDEDDDESVLWDESDTTDSEDDRTSDKGTKSYPYIVSPPNSKEKASPSSTVEPKSILKNKNENHVRFDPPREVEGKSPRSLKDDRRRDRDHHSRRHRDHRDRSPRERDGSGSRYRDGERRNGERRSGERDRYHDDHREKHHRDRRGERRDDRSRDDRSRDDRSREERATKKKSLAETLGAVGIGGAAVSLLSVLAEAASGV